METIATIATCIAACAVGFVVGGKWAPDAIWAAVFGIVVGELCTVIYWALALSLATLVAGAGLDARAVGVDVAILVLATPVCGAIAAVVGYRRTLPPR